MQMKPITLLGLVILVCAFFRAPDRIKPAWLRRLSGWQKLLGVAAFIMALLIVLNPEFLALGMLGDAAFFDVLVLLLSLQLQTFAGRAWYCVRTAFSRMMRIMVPRMSMSFLLATFIFASIGTAVSAIQKAVHRIFS
jgi:hypothetical protein